MRHYCTLKHGISLKHSVAIALCLRKVYLLEIQGLWWYRNFGEHGKEEDAPASQNPAPSFDKEKVPGSTLLNK